MVHACTCTTCCKIGSRIPSPSHFLPHFHLSLNNLQSTQSTYLAIPAGVLHLSLNLASGRVCLWLMVRHFLYALPARLHVVVLDVPRCERDGKDSMFPDFPPKTPQIISIQPSRPPRCGDFPCITHPARYLLSSPPQSSSTSLAASSPITTVTPPRARLRSQTRYSAKRATLEWHTTLQRAVVLRAPGWHDVRLVG